MRMWLARWFGGRKAEADDDEPARVAPPARPVQPVKRSTAASAAKRGSAAKAADKVNSGFDPYNSGSFDRYQAWERVIRR
jgi:hypothetical protein